MNSRMPASYLLEKVGALTRRFKGLEEVDGWYELRGNPNAQDLRDIRLYAQCIVDEIDRWVNVSA